MPPELLADPVFGFDSPMWDPFGHLEWDPRHRAAFLDSDEYNYVAPLVPVKEENEEDDDEQDDTKDYLGYLAYLRGRPRRIAR
jgi:hypothetical protein